MDLGVIRLFSFYGWAFSAGLLQVRASMGPPGNWTRPDSWPGGFLQQKCLKKCVFWLSVRKFRSRTSDNMDRWKSRGGKSTCILHMYIYTIIYIYVVYLLYICCTMLYPVHCYFNQFQWDNGWTSGFLVRSTATAVHRTWGCQSPGFAQEIRFCIRCSYATVDHFAVRFSKSHLAIHLRTS